MFEHFRIHKAVAGGEVSGFVADSNSHEFLEHLHESILSNTSLTSALTRSGHRIAILENIAVDARLRGRGIGNRLMSAFLEQAEELGATAFILFASYDLEQIGGFVLQEWLVTFHFSSVAETADGTLMALPHSFSTELIQEL